MSANDRGSLTGLTREEAKEFHGAFMSSFILFTVIAIIAQLIGILIQVMQHGTLSLVVPDIFPRAALDHAAGDAAGEVNGQFAENRALCPCLFLLNNLVAQ